VSDIREYLSYDPETGVFTRIKAINKYKVGDVLGYVRADGQRIIDYNYKKYMAAKLAWWFVHGYLPTEPMWHINGLSDDNRIANLRIGSKGLIEDIEHHFRYDERTGYIIKKKTGEVAGYIRKDDYIGVWFAGVPHLAHRIAWLLHYGAFPEGMIDHINRVRDDNRIENLRIISRSGNAQNTISPDTEGANWHKNNKRWTSKITIDRKTIHLGSFDTPEEAREAYLTAKRQHHPYWVEEIEDVPSLQE
jgi:hypothetical protein